VQHSALDEDIRERVKEKRAQIDRIEYKELYFIGRKRLERVIAMLVVVK
jgi:hypothetical protein